MKICLISSQIAEWGKIGGFGTATRALGRELARRGVEVVAVIPRRGEHGQGRVEELDGITVYGTGRVEALLSGKIYGEVEADLYHSQEPTIGTLLAQRAVPDAVHVVTCRDPRDWKAHLTELYYSSWKRRLLAPALLFYEAGPLIKRAVRKADAVLTPAPGALHPRIRRLYGDGVHPRFVPSPMEIPVEKPRKAERPTILFVGRFDRRKRLEVFLDLASRFPDVRFVAVGRAHEAGYDRQLREKYGGVPNLEMPGFVPRFGSPGITEYYEKAWILVNASAREGLPYTFIEAAAHGVAILSSLDPDGFASRFGYHVEDGDFESGLGALLKDDAWRERGEAGARFVAARWGVAESVDRHLELYRSLLDERLSPAEPEM